MIAPSNLKPMPTYLVEFFAPGMHGEPLLVYFAHIRAIDKRTALGKASALYYAKRWPKPRLKLVKAASK